MKIIANKNKRFTPWTRPHHYGQIFQSMEIEFSFIDKNGEEVFAPVQCRDFLCDAVLSKCSGNPVSIWGFYYHYSSRPFVDGWLSVHFPDVKSALCFTKHFPALENKHVMETQVYEINPTCLLLKVSKKWFNDPWKISWLTMVIRWASYPSLDEIKNPDQNYFDKTYHHRETMDFLVNKNPKTHTEFWEHQKGYHDQIGVISRLPHLIEYAKKYEREMSEMCVNS